RSARMLSCAARYRRPRARRGARQRPGRGDGPAEQDSRFDWRRSRLDRLGTRRRRGNRGRRGRPVFLKLVVLSCEFSEPEAQSLRLLKETAMTCRSFFVLATAAALLAPSAARAGQESKLPRVSLMNPAAFKEKAPATYKVNF